MANQHVRHGTTLPEGLPDSGEPPHAVIVPAHEPGDYLHSEQRLDLIDEQTGQTHELYVRGNAVEPDGRSEISVFIPITAIRSVQADKKFCVVTLSHPVDGREERARQRTLLSVLAVTPGTEATATTPSNKRSIRRRVRPARAKVKGKR